MATTPIKELLESASKPAESPARTLLERYERAARCGGEGLWEWDLGTGAVWCSPGLEQLLGRGNGSTALDSFTALFEHVHPDHRNQVLHHIRRHLEQQHVLDVTCRMSTAGGELRWFHLRGAAERDRSGRPVRLSGSLRDITDDKRNAEEVRHAEELQRRALDALHAAVGVLNSRGEIVEINRFWRDFPIDRALIGARYGFGENYLALCEKAAARCPEGIGAAAGIRAVMEGKRSSFSLTYSVAVSGTVRYYELRAQPFVDGQTADKTGRGAFIIHMDVSATREAYAALETSRDFYERLLNAIPVQISYVDKHQRVQYMNQSYERWLQLPLAALQGRSVEDITTPVHYSEMTRRIESVLAGQPVEFEQRSRRANGELRELAVAAALYSEPGIGTAVRLYFPRANGTQSVSKRGDSSTPSSAAPGGSETVLVVEEDGDVRATAAGALRSFGYEVLEASTADEGMRTIESNDDIDLLFSDISLRGGVQGPALAHRAQRIRPKLKALFTSGFSESTVVHRGLLENRLKLIAKPYALNDLANRVRAVLDQE